MNKPWYEPLRSIVSLGSQKQRIANMGELAAQRKQHLGQFFTPDEIAAFMWRIVSKCSFTSILDNSIGSGRLVQFAEPGKHEIFGVDVHEDTVDCVKTAVTEAGFSCEVLHAGMEDINPTNMDLAIINPPFSIHLESALLTKHYGCTRMGRYGPDTSATSDEYALYQAIAAAKVVVALLPRETADAFAANNNWPGYNRLRAIFHLPKNAFAAESANVSTSVLVFGEYKYGTPVHTQTVLDWNCDLPELGLQAAFSQRRYGSPSLRHRKLDSRHPTIVLPVTGNNTVTVGIAGRHLSLRFHCGFTEARVRNAILGKRIHSTETNRLPIGVKFSGQGRLDIEVYLLQDNPIDALHSFVKLISENGGQVDLNPSVFRTLQNRLKSCRRQSMPLSHAVWSRGANSSDLVVGIARKTHNVDVSKWISPVIKQGEEVQFHRQPSGTFKYQKGGAEFEIIADELEAKFALQGVCEGWINAHTGLLKAFPQQANLLRQRAKAMGIDKWLTWDFQLDDAIELTMKPLGAIAAWKQGCGKSRLAAALVLLSGMKHGLIVLESRLIGEMLEQLAKVGIESSAINVIESPQSLTTLAQINLISYERLRMPIAGSQKMTYAKKLRRRIGIIVADEGEKLANTNE